jgi:DNA-damage-inducible protein D
VSEIVPASGGSPFDRIKQTRPDGSEFWSARALQGLMGYRRWENLQPAIARAIQSASNTGSDVTSHFLGSQKLIPRPQGGSVAREDYELSRHGAYLVAMNGDPNKPEVAAAQAYFAARTVQAEAVEQRAVAIPAWAQALHALVDQQAAIEVEQQRQAARVREIEARVVSVEGAHGEFTALGYAKLNDLPTNRPWLAQLGKRAAAAMRAAGEEPRKRQDATFGLINVYPTWALDAGLAEFDDVA